MPCIFGEYLLRGHFPDCHGYSRTHHIDDAASPYYVHKRDYDEPYEETAAADDEGIFQPHDIAEPEDGCSRVEFHDELRLVCDDGPPVYDCSGDGLAPQSERRDYEII